MNKTLALRIVIVAALLIVSAAARATYFWEDFQNTSGYTSPASSSCFLYASATFDEQCYHPDSTLAFNGSSYGVVGFFESGGPTLLTYGPISNGQCLIRSGTQVQGTACGGVGGSGGGGTVTTVTATAPIFITGSPTTTPNVTISLASNQVAVGTGSNVTSYANLTNDGTTVTASNGSTTAQALSVATAMTSPTVPTVTIGSTSATGQVLEQFATAGTQRAGLRADYVGNLYEWANAGNLIFATGGDPGAGGGSTFLTGVGSHGQFSATTANHVLKTDGSNNVVNATAGTDYQAPLTACTDYVSTTCQTGATDIGGTNGTTTVLAFENNGTFRGSFRLNEGSSPLPPSLGTLACWADLTNTNLECINNSSQTKHMAANYTCSAHQFATQLASSGFTTCAQPAFTDVSGSLDCSQLPALSNDIANGGGGSCALSVTGIENDAVMRGDLLATEVTAPATPSAGTVRVYADSTFGNINAKGPTGTVNHGMQTMSCGASQWANSTLNSGIIGCAQPAFSDVSGAAACSQLPALTGNATSTAGACATKVVGITESGGASLPIGACSVDGEALVRVSGTVACRLPSGDLSADYTAPSVVGMHDGSGADWPVQATTAWNNGQAISTVSGKLAGLAFDQMVTKIPYYLHIPSLQAGDETNRYLATSMSTQELSGGVVEYPAGFQAGHIIAIMNITASSGSAASMDCFSTRNGAGIAGTDFNFTPGTTSTGVTTKAAQPTGSASANDTYGEECIYNGNFSTGPFGATIAFTLVLELVP